MYTRWAVILVAGLLSGCVSSKVQQGGTPGAARAASGIYLAPFANASGNSEASSAVTEIAATSMMAHGLPVIQSEGLRAQADSLVNSGQQHQLMEIARGSGASHALFGTVHEYRFKSDLDGAPTVGVTTRLVEVASGATVWQGTTAKSGYYYGSLSKTTQTAIDNLVSEMAGNGRIKSSRRKKANEPYNPTLGGSGYATTPVRGAYNPKTGLYNEPTTYSYAPVTANATVQPASFGYQQAPPAVPGYSANANYQTPNYDYQSPDYDYQSPSLDYQTPGYSGGNLSTDRGSWWSRTFGKNSRTNRKGMPNTESFRWTNNTKGLPGVEYEQIARQGDTTTSPWPVANVSAPPYSPPPASYGTPQTSFTPPAPSYTAPAVTFTPASAPYPPQPGVSAPSATWTPSGVLSNPTPSYSATPPSHSATSTWTATGSQPAANNAPRPLSTTAANSSQPTSRWTPSNY